MPFTDWDTLLRRIKSKACTPFIGAGAAAAYLPLGGGLAQQLAQEFDYPLADSQDLARVTEFVAVTKRDGLLPKDRIREVIQSVPSPSFENRREIHRVLAGLGLPIYLTTNYDDFMFRALRADGKDVKREVCRWNKLLLEQESSAFDTGYDPTPANPVVFHLHGHADIPESIVVTEDDYLDFLVNISKDLAVSPTGAQQKAALPVRIRSAIRNTTLLFIGYRLADLNFRVVLRGLLSSIEQSTKRISIAVQLRPDTRDSKNAGDEVDRMQEYLERYFDWTLNLQVYWGPAADFARELQQRLGGEVERDATNPAAR
jgi:SIR2-like domain